VLSFGFVSYLLAAVGFLILTLLLATSWQGRAQGARLVVACGFTTAWAGVLAHAAYVQSLPANEASIPLAQIVLAEFVRDAAWLVVLSGLIERATLPRLLSRIANVLAVGSLVLGIVLAADGVLHGASDSTAIALITGGLAVAPIVLILLEQLFRNATAAGRYALKYFAIAMGAIFVYDLYLYAQALLLKGIEASSWEARGVINALAVPLIAIAARRNPQWSLNVFVSRQVVFYTTTFLAVGTYLIVMALGGYVIRLWGGTWGRPAQLIFFAGAGIVLVSLLASGSVRRRLRVFLSKHFYRNKYDYRLEWLRFIETLSTPEPGVGVRDNCVRAMAQIVSSHGGTLFMPPGAGEALVPVGTWPSDAGTGEALTPLAADDDFVDFVRRTAWVVDFDEYRRTPDVYQNVALPRMIADHPEWRLAVPLIQQGGLLGIVMLERPPEPFELTYEDRDLLKTVGQHVATHLAQHEADRRLAESRQFEAYHRLTAFVMHDLKNLVAQLSLLVANAEKHRRNPDFVDDAISTIANSTSRMQRLIEQLQGREAQSVNRRVALAEVATQACDRTRIRQPPPRARVDGDPVYVEADPERLLVMTEHLIRNAQDACGDEGSVIVSVEADAAWSRLAVEDDGAGMDETFIRERLFRPFDTTKGSKGMGIGAYQVREYVTGLGGRVEVWSKPGRGTRFTLWLPRSDGSATPARP
jgi:putative PEP-CTERM system histidine kinase